MQSYTMEGFNIFGNREVIQSSQHFSFLKLPDFEVHMQLVKKTIAVILVYHSFINKNFPLSDAIYYLLMLIDEMNETQNVIRAAQ